MCESYRQQSGAITHASRTWRIIELSTSWSPNTTQDSAIGIATYKLNLKTCNGGCFLWGFRQISQRSTPPHTSNPLLRDIRKAVLIVQVQVMQNLFKALYTQTQMFRKEGVTWCLMFHTAPLRVVCMPNTYA